MNKSSGSTAAGTVILLIGLVLIGLAFSPADTGSLLPGAVLTWLGISLRRRAKKQDAQPRVPQGFAPAGPDQIQPQQPRESTDIDATAAVPPQFAPPADSWPPEFAEPVPSPAPAPTTSGGSRASAVVSSPDSEETVSVPPQVRAQVVQLATAGRTVEAIDVLREATGMELYEASQYVRSVRKSAG